MILSGEKTIEYGNMGSAAAVIQCYISDCLKNRGECSVMLTGGRSAEKLYLEWRVLPEFSSLNGVHFYFGDERCVPSDHLSSNYGLVMRTLFKMGIPQGCFVHRICAEQFNSDAAAYDYEKKLPRQLDVLLLSVGDDGHVASLFPWGPALDRLDRRVVAVDVPIAPNRRITITPQVIVGAGQVFTLAFGAAKEKILQRILSESISIHEVPARMVLNSTWLLDVNK